MNTAGCKWKKERDWSADLPHLGPFAKFASEHVCCCVCVSSMWDVLPCEKVVRVQVHLTVHFIFATLFLLFPSLLATPKIRCVCVCVRERERERERVWVKVSGRRRRKKSRGNMKERRKEQEPIYEPTERKWETERERDLQVERICFFFLLSFAFKWLPELWVLLRVWVLDITESTWLSFSPTLPLPICVVYSPS